MYLSSTVSAVLLLVCTEGVLGGSRFWEAKAPNERTKIIPDYPATETLNTTSTLVRRALSIDNQPNDGAAPRIWPNKKVRYCFDGGNRGTVIRGLWESAMELWAALKDHGFDYEEVSDSVCDSERSTVLRIYYNTYGRLASTLGIPAIDQAANEADPANAILGPYTHLSDMAGIGQDDVDANVAHELGHVWGLVHEHQNTNYWRVSPEDALDSWSIPQGPRENARFQTNRFNCPNLKDHDASHAKVQAKIDAAIAAGDPDLANELRGELSRLCISSQAAGKHGFSASEWLPLGNLLGYVSDDDFDPDSLMMYPSGSGGKGLSNDRAIVMLYADGTRILNRLTPSNMDVDRLVSLYGNPASATLGVPHNSGSSKWKAPFKKLRKQASQIFHRGGDTKDGTC